MLSQASTSASDVYKENSRILALLDDKAQKTAGVAGVFLAAAFAFLRRESVEDLKALAGPSGLILLGASIAFFMACIICSGFVMWTRRLQLPPDPAKILDACNYLLTDSNGPSDEARENHVRDQINSWNRANQVQYEAISDKSKKLLVTQVLLTLAIMAIAILLCLLTVAAGTRKASPREIQLIPALQESAYVKMQSVQ
jgi:hypothetical protein